ncbi:MAG: hypothetical protein LBP76_10420 [Treponema sp.]|nr:hypothetical protein [Treponema sp.]
MNNAIGVLPPIAGVLLLIAAGIVFIVGFSRYGVNFIKYGFKQTALDSSLEKHFDRLEERLDGMDARIAAIETNHFGHLKDFLSELTSILVDKGVITNQDRARLDNQLRGM